MSPEQAYEEIYRLAREHALILSAAGGVAVIVHPATQRSDGLLEQIKHLPGLGAKVDALAREREAQFKARQLPLPEVAP